MSIREPAAIGFYPLDPQETIEMIERSYLNTHGPKALPKVNENGERKIVAGIVPHAGYAYSGPVAAHFYYELAKDGKPESFILLGPSHTGYPGIGIMTEGIWKTPLGEVPVDENLANVILENCDIILDAPEAHEGEHSLEVQLPFLQHLYNGKFAIVPIAIGMSDFESCQEVGIAIAKAIKNTNKDVVIISSTDMMHYGTYYGYTPAGVKPLEKVLEWIYQTDRQIIERIKKLDGEGVINYVFDQGLTMCGFAPVAAMIEAIKNIGKVEAKVLKYETSYDIRGGDATAIVGYLAMAFYRTP